MAWPYDEHGDSLLMALFGTLWSRQPAELADEQATMIAASVLAARDGYGALPEWSVAGLNVAARVNSLVSELQRTLDTEARKAMESRRDDFR